jgi:hypothetical protein
MTNVTTALVLASEAAEGSAGPSPYLFGGVALVVLLLLLAVTMMIKVGD